MRVSTLIYLSLDLLVRLRQSPGAGDSLSDQFENLGLVVAPTDQAKMRRGDSPLAVDQESRRERVDAAEELRHAVVANHHGVIYRPLLYERLNGLPAVFIHRDAQRGEATILVQLLEFDKPGNFSLARPTPGSPEIEQNDLSSVIGELDAYTVHARQGKVRGSFAVIRGGYHGARR